MPFQKGNKLGGRTKGSRNKRSIELEAEARAKGMTALQVMQHTVEHLMRRAGRTAEPEKTVLKERASDIAAKLAPYMHPRLASVEHTGKDGGPMEMRVHNVPDGVAERILLATGIDVRAAEQETRH